VGSTVSTLDFVKDLDPGLAKALTAAASGAAKAAVGGGDPIAAALSGALNSGVNSAWNSLKDSGIDLTGGESTPEVPIAELDDVYQFETPTESWIDRGMLGQPTDWDTQDLLDALGQQEEEQAGMQSDLLGYDPRIVDALNAADTEQADLQTLLSGLKGGTGSSGASINLGKALSNVGSSAGKTAGSSQTAQQPTGQGQTGQGQTGQKQTDMSSLLGLLASMQGKTPEKEAPIPLVGEIKPYQFSTDLLQGVYGQRMAQGGSVDELMDIIRG
jgi:hypothetical protein